MALPWMTLLLHAPTVVEAARKLYETARRPPAPSPLPPGAPVAAQIESLRQAVDALVEREVQHAAVLADLARQVEVLRARLVLALLAAATAVALALAAVGLAVWR
ncbi:MAG TPA: hypothetical protein VF010_03700 [Methylomirabilota bacterium]|nr:hypothetical protein [Methylomirabilota bacterium]